MDDTEPSVLSVSSVAIRDSDLEDAADQPDVTRPGDHRKNYTRKSSYQPGWIVVDNRKQYNHWSIPVTYG